MSQAILDRVKWDLPGMDKFSEEDIAFFKRDILKGEGIVDSIHSIGWSYWPTANNGFLNEHLLRKIADFIEIQNKPFWDDYEAYCASLEPLELEGLLLNDDPA